MPLNSHCEAWYISSVYSGIIMYEYKIKQGEDPAFYQIALVTMRGALENFAKMSPGTFRCTGVALVARVSLVLGDRPTKPLLANMEKALAYALELDCIPICVLFLKRDSSLER